MPQYRKRDIGTGDKIILDEGGMPIGLGTDASGDDAYFLQTDKEGNLSEAAQAAVRGVPGVVSYDQASATLRVTLENGTVLTVPSSASAATQSLPSLGAPINRYKTTGTDFDFALEPTGNATVGSWGTVPSDAVAIEFWSNGSAADDYIWWATRSGQLSSTGVLATNISNNDGATNPNRRLSNGERVVMPLSVIGAVDSTFRFAGGKSGARMQGRFITANIGFPYSLASAEENVLAGAGASVQLAYTNTTKFPAGTIGVVLQIKGAAGVRARYDGGAPTATFGDLLPNGNYYIDFDKHGVALSALRFFIPSGAWVIANAVKASS